MVLGVVASITVIWVLWPFIARHDLRKGMALMMFYCSINYRSQSLSDYIRQVSYRSTYTTKLEMHLQKKTLKPPKSLKGDYQKGSWGSSSWWYKS
jgi:hypothetical protein